MVQTYLYPDSVIQIFCKAPLAGQVKTRLLPALTAEQAAAVQQELIERLLAFLHQAQLCPLQIWCSPTVESAFFQQQATLYPLTLWQQHGVGLGMRMHHAIARGLQHARHVLLLGCDCPSFTVTDLVEALNALQHGVDVVLAPTEDGGYSLIGMRAPQPFVLEDAGMPWSSPQVLAITRTRIAQRGLTKYETKMQWDIDTFDDLLRYRQLVSSQNF